MSDTISATEARANFQELINRVEYKGERIVIERHGKAVVAIVGLEDLKRLEALEDAIDSELLRRAIAENDGFTTLEAIMQERENE
ncbi:type II toxin-antitoxin system Phd/YefM family antitoxin [Nostoc sp. FACHB-973]|uniref:Antitoxin n=1 Tax=Desmonostoc muscorum LEGE 12446 TaxID=1828758 RepID=A0A8J7A8C0_DESMC|nr:type II toxin-antitoxin system Phd/YefM family antitoxin [Desmonostoc muscorum]MBD2519792.1 type II toxin-antitoxin system Phd/YefM family antitoxin [Nostoc sp. FACHB-973]MCF2147162.1 type II toxin-antitoxin system Phd/YefM family antitoxin [Desmonostoc muscorum LEGE 12446]